MSNPFNPTYPYSNPYMNNNPYFQPQMGAISPQFGSMPQMQGVAPTNPMQAQQPVQPQQTAQMPIKTNKILVTSLDDALNRPAEPNSANVYYHQDEPFAFQIYTDWEGKKIPRVFVIDEISVEEMQKRIRGVKEKDLKGFVTESDLNECLSKFEEKIVQYVKQNVPPIMKPKKREITADKNEDLSEIKE